MLDNIKQREVEIIHINVVGVISEREVREIEDVAKIFLIEERMKDITNIKKESIIEKIHFKSLKKIKINPINIKENPSFLTVRGLN